MKVFLYRPHDGYDCVACIYSEEGDTLGSWFSSDLTWARYDLAKFVPEGAEVVECIGRAALQTEMDAGRLRGLSWAGAPAEAQST